MLRLAIIILLVPVLAFGQALKSPPQFPPQQWILTAPANTGAALNTTITATVTGSPPTVPTQSLILYNDNVSGGVDLWVSLSSTVDAASPTNGGKTLTLKGGVTLSIDGRYTRISCMSSTNAAQASALRVQAVY